MAEQKTQPTNFDRWLSVMRKAEGGYTEGKGDSAGETNMGVTWETYAAYKRETDPDYVYEAGDVKNLTEDEQEIIARRVWNSVRGDDILSPGVAANIAYYNWAYGAPRGIGLFK